MLVRSLAEALEKGLLQLLLLLQGGERAGVVDVDLWRGERWALGGSGGKWGGGEQASVFC